MRVLLYFGNVLVAGNLEPGNTHIHIDPKRVRMSNKPYQKDAEMNLV